jgi:hypothetical protein
MKRLLLALYLVFAGIPAFAKQVTVSASDLPFEVAKTILLSQKGGDSLKVLDDENLKKVIVAHGSFEVDDSILPNDLRQKLEATQKISEVTSNLQIGRDWAEMGRAIGIATREGLNAVTTETAKFAETTPGKFTMFMIAWKVAGTDFLRAIKGYAIGVPLLIFWAWFGYRWFSWNYRGYWRYETIKEAVPGADGKSTPTKAVKKIIWEEGLITKIRELKEGENGSYDDSELLFMLGLKSLVIVLIGGLIFISI